MPLIQVTDIDGQTSWALWKITGDLTELEKITLYSHEREELEQIHNEKKRMEWLAARNALHHIFGNNNLEKTSVVKDGFGKPFLFGVEHQISLAHSFPYAVALFNRQRPAGIDIEKVQEKILKIGKKFMCDHEQEFARDNLVKMTMIWCAKEALYKLYGRKKLLFRENLFIESFEVEEEGHLFGQIRFEGKVNQIPLRYLFIEDYVICFTL